MYFGPPYGIALIAACLQRQGREVLCRDFERSTADEMITVCRSLIREHSIRYVAVGTTSSSRGPVSALVQDLGDQDPSVTLILGGPFATQLHPQLLRWLDIDFVVRGDGEETLGALLDCLDRGDDPASVRGLAFMRNGELVRTADRPRLRTLDHLPYPAFDLFDVPGSLRDHRSYLATRVGQSRLRSLKGKRCSSIPSGLMVLSSYGCAYRCVFCPMSGASSPRYREHSPAYFVDMLEHFAKTYDQRHFIFGDSLFSRHSDHVRAICDDIVHRGLEIKWMCMTRTDHVDEELLKHMAAAGCVEIVFGVESGAPAIQASIGKNLDLSTVGPALDGCDQASIHSVMSLMIGNPRETQDTVYETLALLRDLEPDEAQVKIVKVYPGTKLHDYALEAGALTLDSYRDPDPHPPPYTAEHDAPTLARLARMIRLRTVVVDVDTNTRPRPDLEHDLLRIARRAYHLRFRAGTALRGDLGQLLAFARDLRIPRIELEANAEAYANEDLLAHLGEGNISRYVVLFPTAQTRYHDQAVEGLAQLLGRDRAHVTVQIALLDATIATLDQTVSLLLSKGVCDVTFHYAPSPRGLTPAPAIAGRALLRTMALLTDADVPHRVSGLPYCYLPEHASAMDDIHRPFDELLDRQGQLRNIGRDRRSQRHHTADCAACGFRMICEGFWRDDLTASGGTTP
jgi:radical SAM superfamily enzyme YgiQ (UPF0313 family)